MSWSQVWSSLNFIGVGALYGCILDLKILVDDEKNASADTMNSESSRRLTGM